MSTPGPFEFVAALSEGRGRAFYAKTKGKGYNPFLTARAFSYHLDTLRTAFNLNTHPKITADQHYAYFLNSVRARKRYGKWAKPQKDAVIEAICQHYKCSLHVARQYRQLLSPADIKVVMGEDATPKQAKNKRSRRSKTSSAG